MLESVSTSETKKIRGRWCSGMRRDQNVFGCRTSRVRFRLLPNFVFAFSRRSSIQICSFFFCSTRWTRLFILIFLQRYSIENLPGTKIQAYFKLKKQPWWKKWHRINIFLPFSTLLFFRSIESAMADLMVMPNPIGIPQNIFKN